MTVQRERVVFAKLTELDAAPVVVVEGVNERVGILTHGWGTTKNFIWKRCPAQAEVGLVECRSAL